MTGHREESEDNEFPPDTLTGL
jgi:hypothetical protein